MNSDENDNERRKSAGFVRYLGIAMATVYLLMGFVIAFTPLFAMVSAGSRYILGLILGIYGLFRFYRVFSQK